MPQQFEYLVQSRIGHSDMDLERYLNSLGRDGWRLISTVTPQWVFMREVQTSAYQQPPSYQQPAPAYPQPQEYMQQRYQSAPAPREELPVFGRRRGMGGLTPREQDIVQLVAEGFSNRSIAQRLQLQEQSIKNLVSAAMRKLGAENRTQVALKYWEMKEQAR